MIRVLTLALGLLTAIIPLFPQSSALAQLIDHSGSENEFVLVYAPKPLLLDPLHIYTTMETEISTALYEGLLAYHPFSLDPVPGVAKSWDVSEDKTVYRFYLREDALYSNGDPVRAQDFKSSWMRVLDPEAGAEYSILFDVIKGARAYRLGQTQEEPQIRVVSARILEVELEKPANHFLKLLAHLSFSPIHPHYLDKKDWDQGPTIVGNGPFYIIERSEEELLLAKNALYWDAAEVELERVRIRFMTDTEQITRGFNEGTIHWSTNWDSSLLNDRSKIVFNPLFATSYFYFVCAEEPWNDERVRVALSLLLPWQEIRTESSLFATNRLIPSFNGYPDVQGLGEGGEERALELLKEAGYPQGANLPQLTIKIPEDSESRRIAAIMADSWKTRIGLRTEVITFPYNQYLKEVKNPGYTVGAVTWIGDYADPLTFLQMWTTGSNLNDARYSDPEFDGLVEASFSKEGDARYRTLSQAEEVLLGKAVVLPINHAPAFNLIDLDRIEGSYPNLLNIHPFKYIRFHRLRLPPGIALGVTFSGRNVPKDAGFEL